MRVRTLLLATAFTSSLLGAVVVYLVLTVPNDLNADALLKQARRDISAGRNARGRESLTNVVQHYPRTDAAAAATVALVKLAEEERQKLDQQLEQLRQESAAQRTEIDALTEQVTQIASAPPRTVVVETPAKQAPAKKAPAKKAPVPRRRRR
jgi:DNA-binding protein H-NS